MAKMNGFAVKIPDGDMAEIRGAIGVLQAKLGPHLMSLSADDRRELPKMGDKTMSFVQKAYEYGRKNKELAPPFLDLAEFETDVSAVSQLRELSQTLNPVIDALRDSLALSGSEAYKGALVFYGSVKAAAKINAPNARTIYEDLSSRFPSGERKKKV